MYCAVIGDLVESRHLDNRYEVQEQLKQLLKDLNRTYDQDLAAGFVITLGDEFQGLFHQVDHVMDILETIRLKMYPVKVRFGLGLGVMATAIDPAGAIGADGPAFYAARAGINRIKEAGGRYESPVTDMVIRHYNTKLKISEALPLVDHLLSATSLIESKWTTKQREIIEKLSLNQLSQREIGEALQVSQANVHGRIASAGYYTYRYCMDGVSSYLNKYWEDLDGK